MDFFSESLRFLGVIPEVKVPHAAQFAAILKGAVPPRPERCITPSEASMDEELKRDMEGSGEAGRKTDNDDVEVVRPGADAQEAIANVLDCLRRLRKTGAETRAWSEHALGQLNEKIQAVRRTDRTTAGGSLLSDLLAWEGHILQVVRHYMQEAADTMNRIRTFSPPLRDNQLRPFLQAVETDRKLTIEALNPLTDAVEALGRLKRSAEKPPARRAANG